ncbi:hypothetical protein LOZ36_003617 [Ophidiomyces ophidiicola]|nr:hypothetical protein LOZ36_003617 [Ophidiomyces ophidiicola]
MVPGGQYEAQDNGKQPVQNQEHNSTSNSPNQAQALGINKDHETAMPLNSHGVNNNQHSPESPGGKVPLHLSVTTPSQPPLSPEPNIGNQMSQSTNGSPVESHIKNGRKKNQEGHLWATGETNTPKAVTPVALVFQPTASSPVAKVTSGDIDAPDRHFLVRSAQIKEQGYLSKTPVAAARKASTGVQSGERMDTKVTPLARHKPHIAIKSQVRPTERPAPPGQWANFSEAIRVHDTLTNEYVFSDKDLDIAELDNNVLNNNSLSGERKLQQLLEPVQEQQKGFEFETLTMENHRLSTKLQSVSKDSQTINPQAVEPAAHVVVSGALTELLEAHRGIAGTHEEVWEYGAEYTSQMAKLVNEITSASKHIEGLQYDLMDVQPKIENDKDKPRDFETQEAMEQTSFVSLESEGIFEAMEGSPLAEYLLMPEIEAPPQEGVTTSPAPAPVAMVDVAHTFVQSVACQTVDVDVLDVACCTDVAVVDVSMQTDAKIFLEMKDTPVQTEPVIISESGWWRGLMLVFLMLIWVFLIFWNRNGQQQMWLEANDGSGLAPISSIFFLPELRYNLNVWLQVDRVMLG